MGCHSPSEDLEDDDMEFLAAAQEDDHLVALVLIGLSRSGTPLPWHTKRTPPSPVTKGATRPLLLPRTTWGGRRTRSRSITLEGIIDAKREELEEEAAAADRRASPATPLSWSGGSGTGSSGSEGGDGWRAPSQPGKREAEVYYSRERIRAPPSKRLMGEQHRDAYPRGAVEAASAVAFFSGYRSRKKVVDVAVGGAETSRTAAQVELMRSELTCSGSIGFRRPGKKKVAEHQELEESLSLEQEELPRELEKHKEIYHAPLEENTKLKNVESRVAPHVASDQTATGASPEEEANHESLRHVESVSESRTADEASTVPVVAEDDGPEQLQRASSPVPAPRLFDLNCLPDECI